MSLKHPGGAIGYSFETHSKKVLIALEHEFDPHKESDLLAFLKNADPLIWDGMYIDVEMATRKGWGHPSIEQEFFIEKTNVKKLLLVITPYKK